MPHKRIYMIFGKPLAGRWVIVSQNTNAVSGKGYLTDVSSQPVTITLPASPAIGAVVGVSDYKVKSSTNAITVARNGSLIDGAAADYVMTTPPGQAFIFTYSGESQGWTRQVCDPYPY